MMYLSPTLVSCTVMPAFLESLFEPQIAHNCNSNLIFIQHTLLLAEKATDHHYMVAIHKISLFINSDQTISVTIKGKP